MEQTYTHIIFGLVLVFFCGSASLASPLVANPQPLQTYIIHVHGNTISSFEDRVEWHKSFLPVDIDNFDKRPRLIYSYGTVASGFAARLSETELADVKKKPGFIHAFADHIVSLQTTRTPYFLGLNSRKTGLWKNSSLGRGIIIGILDTGISPNHPSFSDKGMPSPPAKWKGVCEFNASQCNNKLIGARSFIQGSQAMQGSGTTNEVDLPDDSVGHGTHTSGTAAGVFVADANIDNQAYGLASGMAPNAHLAVYKVCTGSLCAVSDVLAAMDVAVADGVDILSLSIGGARSSPYHDDGVAIGTFGAIEKGVFVSCAAGNNGPSDSTLTNEAPWILTVGASTIDREVRTTVALGNKASYNGQSAFQPKRVSTALKTLAYPGSISSVAWYCENGTLSNINVRGKVVLCDDGKIELVEKGKTVKKAGGAGMIIANLEYQGDTPNSEAHVLPASQLSYSDGLAIKTYLNSTQIPTASIKFMGTLIGTSPAPVVAYFSSRGPSVADPNILKPDIIGPGVNILAAWPFFVGTPGAGSKFNFFSGTSMATPHLSGIAALLKGAHPDWSPAAIKSAMMTSVDINANDGQQILDQHKNIASFFDMGAGHVNPTRANSPGLVYDVDSKDYIAYLCGLHYTDAQVSTIVRRHIQCSKVRSISGMQLNYPSFMVSLNSASDYTLTVTRTVTNVGASNSYALEVIAPTGVSVTVNPKHLSFRKGTPKVEFSVTFTSIGGNDKGHPYREGYLMWVSSDKITAVRSPIMVYIN